MDFTVAGTLAAIKTSVGALSGIQSAAVLKERIALLQDQLGMLEKAAIQAEERVASQAKEIEELNRQLAQYRSAEEYTEYRGALFKRNPNGADGYQPVAFCPTCKTAVGAGPRGMPMVCGRCQWITPFRALELPGIVRDLSAK